MIMRISSVASGFSVLVASFALLGCGGDGGDAAAPAAGGAAAPSASAPASTPASGGAIPAPMQAFSADGNVAEVVIEGDDMIRFSINRFSVSPGQMVRVTLNHVGSLPAQAMGHNVVILQAGDNAMEFGADVGMSGGSAANEFVPESLRDRVVAFTNMIGGGQSATVEFQAPTEPGEYPFLCTFPGHFAQMNGIMVVE